MRDRRCARRFERQLRADCALLEALRVMDYSLLLGIHSRSGGGLASTPQHTDAVCNCCLLWASHPGVRHIQERTHAPAAHSGSAAPPLRSMQTSLDVQEAPDARVPSTRAS
jgi:Phosphatidylinositol-4-phosphate 5-Kinase